MRNPIATAPTDGTMVRLLVEFDDHALEDDTSKPIWTIGVNNFDHDGTDEWKFAGWCWSHDNFTQGQGVPVGWLPMVDDNMTPGATETTERLARQCDAVAHMAKALADLHVQKARLHRMCPGAAADVEPVVGPETASLMQTLGDILNNLDAVVEEDAWTNPIIEEAQRIYGGSS